MEKKEIISGYAMVVLDRGFVYVGEVEICEKWCVIKKAKNIRRYGTKRGLGELAISGPTGTTELDETGDVRAPMPINHIIETEEAKWK